jgi:TruD family tRNA pseudouridine synthase
MNILEAKKIENQNLREAMRRMPRFFETTTFLDDQNFLEKYGIFIPEKKKLPKGYLKLWPQDFIVEEITTDGERTNVFPDKFISKKREFLYEDSVIWGTLVKCNLSSIEVVEELARYLKILPEQIKFGGIKDKHAITSQLVSMKGVEVEKLHQLSAQYFFIKDVFSGKRENHLGNLRGNQFTILIRTERPLVEKDFLEKLKEIEKQGFYNFYYLQRFGIPRLINAECGLSILKGDYEGAMKIAFCRPGERELIYFRNLRKEIEKLWGDWLEIQKIIDFFPNTFQDERQMIGRLVEHPADFVGAINQIPRVVQLWLNSFASLLYNRKLSSFLKQNKKVPAALPSFISPERGDWLLYEDYLKDFGLFSQTFVLKNLQPFKEISVRHRDQKTIEKAQVLTSKVIPQGVILNFNLPKGCYATTFLSHLFNLVSGALPKKFSNLPIDTKANLKQQSLEEILNKFSDVVSTPSWRLLWRIY